MYTSTMRIPTKQLALALAIWSVPSGALAALSLGDVSFHDLDEIIDTHNLSNDLRAGIDLFLRDYPDLAAQNADWLETAELSAGGSRSKESGFDSWYLRLDLAYGDNEESFAFRTNPEELGSREYAQALRNLAWTVSRRQPARESPPLLIRRFDVTAFLSDIPYGGMLPATSIAALGDGRIVLGHSMYATILDPKLRILGTIGKELSATAKYSGYNLRASQAGTILSNMAGSADILQFNPPDAQARSVATGISSIETYAWLGDGTLVAKEMMTRRVVAVEKKKRIPLRLAEFNAQYESASFTPGPDGSLISLNPTKRFITWYDKEGTQLKRLIPCLTEEQFGTIRSVAWLKSGHYLITGTGYACKADENGDVVWFLPLDTSLGMMFYEAAWSEADKSVYAIFPGGKTVCQFMEAEAFAASRSVPQGSEANGTDWALLRDIDQALLDTPDDVKALERLADYYLSAGASDYALSLYETCAQYGGDNGTIAKTIARLKTDQLAATAKTLTERARRTIREIGPESAKADYSAAMSAYERALALKPGDKDLVRARAELSKTMKDAEAGINTPVPPLTLDDIVIPPIFPALLATYSTNPAGTITVRNATDHAVTNVRGTFYIPRFMDFPAPLPSIALLEDGETATIPIYAALNASILDIEEDLPVQTSVTLAWEVNGEAYDLERNPSTTIYRRTALTWDDSGKLASFITPNEETVSAFAMALLDPVSETGDGKPDGENGSSVANLSARMWRASAIVSGLAGLRIRYQEDPQSPLSAVMGTSVSVDTVRFPRTTLFYRTGDCDDTTVLLSSLLEAAGIPTAILTTPAHVFLAIDTGLSETKRWMLESAGSVLSYGGHLWMPLESTALDDGLEGAWSEASKLTVQWEKTGEFEFLPVADLRSKYPPTPLPRAGIPLERPDPATLTERFRTQDARLTSLLYDKLVESYSRSVSDKENETRRLNRLGILHGTFANPKAAFAAFDAALRLDPGYTPALVNLANLSYLAGDAATAREYLGRLDPKEASSKAVLSLAEKIRTANPASPLSGGTRITRQESAESGLSAGNRASDSSASADWAE